MEEGSTPKINGSFRDHIIRHPEKRFYGKLIKPYGNHEVGRIYYLSIQPRNSIYSGDNTGQGGYVSNVLDTYFIPSNESEFRTQDSNQTKITKMHVQFLQISTPLPKEGFIQHIKKLVYVQLDKGDSYNNLFNKLEAKFDEGTKEREGINEWVSFNREQFEDQSTFDAVIAEEDGLVAHFNFIEN